MFQPLLGVGSLLQEPGIDDIILLPLCLLGTLYIYNKGSFWPQKDPWDFKWYEVPQASMGLASTKSVQSRNIAERLAESQTSVAIFWGSQSGTAEGFAHRLARDLHQRFDVNTMVVDLSDFDAPTLSSIPDSMRAIFIVSTYGEGEPSDNAQELFSWISTGPKVTLNNLRYAAFGCGNSNYRYFNKIVDDLSSFLNDNGAITMTPIGKGNEATRTTEEDFMDWKEKVIQALCSELRLKEVVREYEPEVLVEYCSNKPGHLHNGEPFHEPSTKKASSTHSGIFAAQVTSGTEIAKAEADGRSCVELTLDLTPHPEIKYKTGDHLAVWPENSAQDVSDLIHILGLETKRLDPIQVTSRAGQAEPKVPSRTTIEALFRHYLEISSPISREAVLCLANAAPSASAKQLLQTIGKNKAAYASFLESNYLTFARLLAFVANKIPGVSWHHLPLPQVIDLIPTMKPRLYSISSSRITSPRHVSITVSVKPQALAKDAKVLIPGLASTYLQKGLVGEQIASKPNFTLWAQIRQSTFKLPVAATVPLMMVAAGTGIAPFRAFIQERARLRSIGREIGRMVLFFGCRNDEDFLYSHELNGLTDGPLQDKLEVITVFSRAAKKTYVQDQVGVHQKDVKALLHEHDAAFYICGAATMAKEVNGTLTNIMQRSLGWSDAQVEDWRAERKRSNRWFEDVWS